MKNFVALFSKAFFTISLLWLLSGCASTFLIGKSEPQNVGEVFRQLVNYSADIEKFTLNARFEICPASNDTFRTAGSVKYTRPESWKIVIDGPLGMKMAIIELEGDDYSVTIPGLGQSFSGDIRDSEALQVQNVALPRFDILPTILMPMPFIESPGNWKVDKGSSFSDGLLVLTDAQDNGKMTIQFAHNPFRVISEEHWENGKQLYSRTFSYDGKSTIQEMISVNVDDIVLNIEVRSWNIEIVSTV